MSLHIYIVTRKRRVLKLTNSTGANNWGRSVRSMTASLLEFLCLLFHFICAQSYCTYTLAATVLPPCRIFFIRFVNLSLRKLNWRYVGLTSHVYQLHYHFLFRLSTAYAYCENYHITHLYSKTAHTKIIFLPFISQLSVIALHFVTTTKYYTSLFA